MISIAWRDLLVGLELEQDAVMNQHDRHEIGVAKRLAASLNIRRRRLASENCRVSFGWVSG